MKSGVEEEEEDEEDADADADCVCDTGILELKPDILMFDGGMGEDKASEGSESATVFKTGDTVW